MGSGDPGREGDIAAGEALKSADRSGRQWNRLLRKAVGVLFWRGSEVNRGQEGTDQHHQQIDFHDFLRCAIAAQRLRFKWRSIPVNRHVWNVSMRIRNG